MPGLGFILSLFGGSFFKAIGGFFKRAWAFFGTPVGRYVAAALIGLMLVGLADCHGQQTGRAKEKASWTKVVRDLRTDLTTCRKNTATLQSSLDAQNDAVKALNAEGRRRAEIYAKGARAREKHISDLDNQIARLKSQPAVDICTQDAPWEG